MKSLFIGVLALLLTQQVFAQASFEFTAGYTPGFSAVLNNQDFNDNGKEYHAVNYGSHSGITVGVNFTEQLGLATGVGMSFINQHFSYDYTLNDSPQRYNSQRSLAYLRIPVLFRVGGDASAPVSFFLRFGPHLDILTSAKSTYTNLGTVIHLQDNVINYLDQKDDRGETEEVYKSAVLGATLEVGGRFKLNDKMGLLLLFHVNSSLTNPEGADAVGYLHSAFLGGGPSYRDPSWNAMLGANISFQYTIGS
ncbi:MAG: outer membrane beta-barrel protein [Aureispira sp.]